MNRETIYAAAFAKFSGAAGFVTKSRRLRHWTAVAPEEMPALFMVQTTEDKAQQRGLPPKWTFRGELYVYVHTAATTDDTVVPSQLLNPLLDALEAAIGTDDKGDNVQTLGGLVSHCWIDGTIETSEGNLGDQEIAIVPFAMLVP